MQVNEHRRKAYGLPDLLRYASIVDDGIMLLQDGSLLSAWAFRGPDLSFATFDEMDGISRQLNGLLKLGDGWMVHCDAMRSFAPGYPERGAFPDAVTALMDEERRAQFMYEGSHLETEYVLSLTYRPPSQKEEKIRGYVFDNAEKKTGGVAERVLEFYKGKISAFEGMFSLLLRARRLKSVVEFDEFGNDFLFDDLLRYIRRTIQGEDYKFALPKFPMFLHDTLGAMNFVAGVEPRIGNKHIGVVAIDAFPSYSAPGFLAGLDGLPFEYRFNTRAILLDPETAKPQLEKRFKKWRGAQQGFFAQLMGSQRAVTNQHAVLMTEDAASAMSVAAAGDVLFLNYSANVILLHEDRVVLQEQLGEVVKVLKNTGFGARIEDFNAVEAWLGSLPGEGYANPRRFMQHTLNLADSLPIASVWTGEKTNPSALMPRNSPPLMMTTSSGATPFRVNLHVQDLGHTTMIGPSGAGKSTALALIVAQWFRYPKARVICFDKGKSMYVLNQATGGRFYDLGGDTDSINFCPLADLDTNSQRAWAVEYVEQLCELNGLNIIPQTRNEINDAIQRMAHSPESRSLMDFLSIVQNKEIREALKDFTSLGPNGSLLDAREDTLRDSRFTVFEMETLMGSGDASSRGLIAVMLYLFRTIERRLDGSPTLVVLDEAWVFLANPQFRAKIREWLKVFRKMNAVIIMATQSLSDVMASDISDVIIESCPTKILLANVEANNDTSRHFYQRLGLNQRVIQGISRMIPKRDYLLLSPIGQRAFTLGLGGVAKSFVAVSSVEDRKTVQEFQRKHGERWVYEWLRYRASLTGDAALTQWAERYAESMSSENA